jgi:hypothetical protein
MTDSFSTAFDGAFDVYTPRIIIRDPDSLPGTGDEVTVIVRSPAPNPRRDQAVEDLPYRDPEWETIEAGYGQTPTMRTYLYDPVHGYFMSEGPKVQIKRPERPE